MRVGKDGQRGKGPLHLPSVASLHVCAGIPPLLLQHLWWQTTFPGYKNPQKQPVMSHTFQQSHCLLCPAYFTVCKGHLQNSKSSDPPNYLWGGCREHPSPGLPACEGHHECGLTGSPNTHLLPSPESCLSSGPCLGWAGPSPTYTSSQTLRQLWILVFRT